MLKLTVYKVKSNIQDLALDWAIYTQTFSAKTAPSRYEIVGDTSSGDGFDKSLEKEKLR